MNEDQHPCGVCGGAVDEGFCIHPECFEAGWLPDSWNRLPSGAVPVRWEGAGPAPRVPWCEAQGRERMETTTSPAAESVRVAEEPDDLATIDGLRRAAAKHIGWNVADVSARVAPGHVCVTCPGLSAHGAEELVIWLSERVPMGTMVEVEMSEAPGGEPVAVVSSGDIMLLDRGLPRFPDAWTRHRSREAVSATPLPQDALSGAGTSKEPSGGAEGQDGAPAWQPAVCVCGHSDAGHRPHGGECLVCSTSDYRSRCKCKAFVPGVGVRLAPSDSAKMGGAPGDLGFGLAPAAIRAQNRATVAAVLADPPRIVLEFGQRKGPAWEAFCRACAGLLETANAREEPRRISVGDVLEARGPDPEALPRVAAVPARAGRGD